jgi:hypothetical protein
MHLDYTLLDIGSDTFSTVAFNACLNARGLYNPRQFVLRLSPRVHQLVDEITKKTVVRVDDIDDETLQAYSTYLHETIHWWQHKGSTHGFLRSVLYPAQTHANWQHLLDLTTLVGPQKSIKSWAEGIQKSGGERPPEADRLSNSIVNNFIDNIFFLKSTLEPSLIRQIAADRYFESPGHSTHVAYGLAIHALSDVVGVGRSCLPDTAHWESEFAKLTNSRTQGYFRGTPIVRPPVGLRQIVEGQARFIQLQFLSFARGGMRISDARAAHLLDGIYGDAFAAYLRIVKSAEPENVDDPVVALFLLICDLSLNPTAGFPFQILDFPYFYLESDPGIRFADLCFVVESQQRDLLSRIRRYSREEYLDVCNSLSEDCRFENPMNGITSICQWRTNTPDIEELMQEHKSFKFGDMNLAMRLLLAEFIEFSSDKAKRPEFFCWPGVWMSGERFGRDEIALWLKHLSLYTDKADDDGIFPRKVPGRLDEDVSATFNRFYWSGMLYDMVAQWVLEDGPFRLDYRWLSRSIEESTMAEAASRILQKHFGVSTHAFSIVR